jgi:hypothetical protein
MLMHVAVDVADAVVVDAMRLVVEVAITVGV